MLDEAAILDASPIILLARAGFLDFLRVLNRPLVVLHPVAEEVLQKGRDDIAARALQKTGLFTTMPAPEVDPSVGLWNLGRGETAVLSWARTRPGCLVILDDLQARRCAEWLQIPTSGTIGIVLRAKNSGLVDAARPALQRLISVGMHLSDRTLNAVLLRVGE
jgi:predicted nucleic acid-binding protein